MYINKEELIKEFESKLKKLNYSSKKIETILSSMVNDPIHSYEEYMSEYVDDVIIDDKEYKKYYCWINDIGFYHNTYYLKDDLFDDSVDAYVNAYKLYELLEKD